MRLSGTVGAVLEEACEAAGAGVLARLEAAGGAAAASAAGEAADLPRLPLFFFVTPLAAVNVSDRRSWRSSPRGNCFFCVVFCADEVPSSSDDE